MKNTLFILLCVVAFASCEKADMPVTSTGYNGTFELRARYGGIAGINEKYAPGNKNFFQLDADSTYKVFEKDTLRSHGTFRIKKNADTLYNVIYDRIYYNGDTSYGTEIRLNGDILTLGTDITDNIATEYKRIK
nr:hypothetical protein [uncultured Mucilaginibacter sp.]